MTDTDKICRKIAEQLFEYLDAIPPEDLTPNPQSLLKMQR